MNRHVRYNTDLKIASVGPSAWAKLGPEQWFHNYKIVCGNSRGFSADYVIDLGVSGAEGALTTPGLIRMRQFQDLADAELADYRFVVYKPVHVPHFAASRFIANDISYARFENKREFRAVFSGKVTMPEYRVVPFGDLLGMEPVAAYGHFTTDLGSVVIVLQDELNGGGRGTFIVRTADDMRRALQVLQTEHKGEFCVVSRFIAGIERSMQVFVSATTVMPGPLQQQLVRNAELLNPNSRGGMYFCGGQLVDVCPAVVREQIDQAIAVISAELQATGYKGIFGVDFLVGNDGQVYVLEVNARTTGLLPLLNEQSTDVPLYLLHILELAGEPYQILSAEPTPASVKADGPRSFIVLFNQQQASVYLDKSISTGNYQVTPGGLHKLDDSPRWNAKSDILVQLFCSSSFPAEPSQKICNIFLRGQGFDDDGQLNDAAREALALVKQQIITA